VAQIDELFAIDAEVRIPSHENYHSEPVSISGEPHSVVVRRSRSRIPAKPLIGATLGPFSEGRVCSPLCSTTGVWTGAARAACFKRLQTAWWARRRTGGLQDGVGVALTRCATTLPVRSFIPPPILQTLSG
jgi:hypothetical protein